MFSQCNHSPPAAQAGKKGGTPVPAAAGYKEFLRRTQERTPQACGIRSCDGCPYRTARMERERGSVPSNVIEKRWDMPHRRIGKREELRRTASRTRARQAGFRPLRAAAAARPRFGSVLPRSFVILQPCGVFPTASCPSSSCGVRAEDPCRRAGYPS